MRLLNKLSVAVITVLLVTGSLWAQDFDNTGGSYNASCAGVIKFLDDPTITDIGTSAADKIPGTVDFASTDEAQTIANGLHFKYLVISNTGGGVTIGDVFIYGGDCDATGLLPEYSDLATYDYFVPTGTADNRTYNGTFTYAGTVNQTIFPESGTASGGTNIYNNLALLGGSKDTDGNGDPILTLGTFDLQSTATLQLNDSLGVFDGTGTSNIDGALTIAAGGSFGFNDAGTLEIDAAVNVNDGGFYVNQGTVTGTDNADFAVAGPGLFGFSGGTFTSTGDIAVTGTDASNTGELIIENPDVPFDVDGNVSLGGEFAEIEVADGGIFEISGNFTNAFADRTNMNFNDGSTVRYNGDNNVLATASTNPYSRLEIIGSGTYGVDNNATVTDINVAGGALFDGSSLDVDGATNASQFVMTNADSNIAFNGDEEIIGRSTRTAINTGTNYYYNNAYTYASFNTAPAGPDYYFTINVIPGANGANVGNHIDYDNTVDVNREITVDYLSNADVTLGELSLGYLSSEVPGSVNESVIRTLEGYDNTTRGQIIGASDLTYTVTPTGGSGFGNVLFAGTGDLVFPNGGSPGPGNNSQIFDDNAMVISAGPTTIVSVRNGRWSHPETWGGVTPLSNDDVKLAHIVYTGIDVATAFGEDGYDVDEQDIPGITGEGTNTPLLANSVEILSIADAQTFDSSSDQTALVIGTQETTMDGVTLIFSDATGTNPAFTNNNTNTKASNWVWDETYTTGSSWTTANQGLHGLYIMKEDNIVGQMRINTLTNSGHIQNYGIIEVGE